MIFFCNNFLFKPEPYIFNYIIFYLEIVLARKVDYFTRELIFNGRLNWRIVVLEDRVLWWKLFGNNWPYIFLQYI